MLRNFQLWLLAAVGGNRFCVLPGLCSWWDKLSSVLSTKQRVSEVEADLRGFFRGGELVIWIGQG